MISLLKAGKIETTYMKMSKAPCISYECFKNISFVRDGFSTRLGGVSTGIYESMNFSVKMGDSPENVRKNFDIFLKENHFENPVMSAQTHATNVRLVTKSDIGNGIYRPSSFDNVDGLITDEKGITLVTTFADCVPLYFVDLKNKAIGLSHSGWRGTVNAMGKSTLDAMKTYFGTEPENVIAAIGPSICANCYEVGQDVACEFEKKFMCEPEIYPENGNIYDIPQDTGTILYKKQNGKYMLNLWAANYRVLLSAGIPEKNISIPDICTCCNKDVLFSHRGHMGKRGNLCAFLQIIP